MASVQPMPSDASRSRSPCVAPGLYVGPFLYAKSASWLRRHGITHIVNATSRAPCLFPEQIVYMRVAVEDHALARISKHFDSVFGFVSAAQAAGGSVLVHCQMGRSRSATLAAAVLIRRGGISAKDAIRQVQVARPWAAPNAGFVRQLQTFEAAPRVPAVDILEVKSFLLPQPPLCTRSIRLLLYVARDAARSTPDAADSGAGAGRTREVGAVAAAACGVGTAACSSHGVSTCAGAAQEGGATSASRRELDATATAAHDPDATLAMTADDGKEAASILDVGAAAAASTRDVDMSPSAQNEPQIDLDERAPSAAALSAFRRLHSHCAESLSEVGFVRGPLDASLFADQLPPARVFSVSVPVLGKVMIEAGGKVAIDRCVLPQLWREAHAAWQLERRWLLGLSSTPSEAAAAAMRHHGEMLMQATAAVLLLSFGQCYTAWNDRKRYIAGHSSGSGAARDALHADLRLSDVVLRSFPKAHEAWTHRRWLLRRRLLEMSARLSGALRQEVDLALAAMHAKRANYHAARHGAASISLVRAAAARGAPDDPPLDVSDLDYLTDASRERATRQPSDASVMHLRRSVLRAQLQQAQPVVISSSAGPASAAPADGGHRAAGGALPAGYAQRTDEAVLIAEEGWTRDMLQRMPWHEALWAHRRAILCFHGIPQTDGLSAPIIVRDVRAEASAMQQVFDGKPFVAFGSNEQMLTAKRLLVSHLRWAEFVFSSV